MKNYFDEVMIRLNTAKDRISKFEGRLTEIQNEDEQSKKQRALSK